MVVSVQGRTPIALRAPTTGRSSAARPFFHAWPVSVVASTTVTLRRKTRRSGSVKAGWFTMTKSCVTSPSEPGRRSPSTPITLIAMPRGTEMSSSVTSPRLVERRITTG